jgi:hypothetical protein
MNKKFSETRLGFKVDFPSMLYNDFFANMKTQTCPLPLRLEKFVFSTVSLPFHLFKRKETKKV